MQVNTDSTTNLHNNSSSSKWENKTTHTYDTTLKGNSKRGCNYEDQLQDEYTYITYLTTPYEEIEVSSTTNSTSNEEYSPKVPENDVSPDEDPESLWDISLDQYTLTFTNSA